MALIESISRFVTRFDPLLSCLGLRKHTAPSTRANIDPSLRPLYLLQVRQDEQATGRERRLPELPKEHGESTSLIPTRRASPKSSHSSSKRTKSPSWPKNTPVLEQVPESARQKDDPHGSYCLSMYPEEDIERHSSDEEVAFLPEASLRPSSTQMEGEQPQEPTKEDGFSNNDSTSAAQTTPLEITATDLKESKSASAFIFSSVKDQTYTTPSGVGHDQDASDEPQMAGEQQVNNKPALFNLKIFRGRGIQVRCAGHIKPLRIKLPSPELYGHQPSNHG